MSIIKFDKLQKNNSLRLLDPAGCVHAGGGVLVISQWSLGTLWVIAKDRMGLVWCHQ